MAVTSAVSDLFKSFYELVSSILNSAYAVIHSFVTAVVNFVSGIFTLAGDVFQGLIDVAGGVGKFVTGNLLLISIGVLGAFAYFRYTAQGRQVTAGKKTN